ncbi:NAD(P)H-dependent FMN reductase [Rhodococcus fascians]|uniref:NADPH-dependent FMN reductase n=1 Tax=Nocardiaceae TaxID=85025 RepID=UPI001C912C1D|nr:MULTISPECIES: NAD(P)H-dependent oxidoreductase [Rhodococcus]MBY4023630.1 NAD(P)H-dependent oxidoreductase [Rhodococcus fascians]MDR6908174.1 NAD(P)H-dependent FMN reductase [Rhodococcus sp. 3258]MDR6931009.1 NAD(P)H-dependent FMN reductase [Rhodococcus fascians]
MSDDCAGSGADTIQPIRLAVVTGSVREGRVGPTVAAWVRSVASARDSLTVVDVDLADFDLPNSLTSSEGSERFTRIVGEADAFVLVTPEYNHAVPGSLKTALDTVKYEWRSKPVGFVSYGGLAGGVRATEQLRLIAAELHMVSVRDSVSLHRVRRRFDEAGGVDDPAAVDSLGRLLDQLEWWAGAVSSARARVPYPG